MLVSSSGVEVAGPAPKVLPQPLASSSLPQQQELTVLGAPPSSAGAAQLDGGSAPQGAHASEVQVDARCLVPQGSDVSEQLGELPPTVEETSGASGSEGQGSRKPLWHVLRSWLPVCVAPQQLPSNRAPSMFSRLSSRPASRFMRSAASAPATAHEVGCW
jgi:hypothetical protein